MDLNHYHFILEGSQSIFDYCVSMLGMYAHVHAFSNFCGYCFMTCNFFVIHFEKPFPKQLWQPHFDQKHPYLIS